MKYQIISNHVGRIRFSTRHQRRLNQRQNTCHLGQRQDMSVWVNSTRQYMSTCQQKPGTPPKSHMEPAPQKGETSIYYKTSILSPHVLVFRGVYRDPTPTSPKTSSRKFMLPAFL